MTDLCRGLTLEPYQTPRGYIQPGEVTVAVTAITNADGDRVDAKRPAVYLGLGKNGLPAIRYIHDILQNQRSQLRAGRLLKLTADKANRFLLT